MAYESRAYDNEHGDPVAVLVATGTHDVSRLVQMLNRGNAEQCGVSEQLLRQIRRHNGGRAALALLKAHGGADFTDEQSPTDPDALGAWLRALPDGTILIGAKGIGWQITNIVVESFLLGARTYRAISSMAAEAFEITDGCADLDKLTVAAPFTVLHLGGR